MKNPEEKTFWLGTLPACPIQQLTIAGVCFPRTTTIREKREDVEVPVGHRRGALVKLTAEKAAKVLEAIPHHVVRWRGKPNENCEFGERGDVLDTRPREGRPVGEMEKLAFDRDREQGFTRRPEDVKLELGVHLFFVEVTKPEDAPEFHQDEILGKIAKRPPRILSAKD